MATFIGSHLTREPTVSPVLTKWWMWELILATKFGSTLQMVAKVGSQILATKFGFVPDCWSQGSLLSRYSKCPSGILLRSDTFLHISYHDLYIEIRIVLRGTRIVTPLNIITTWMRGAKTYIKFELRWKIRSLNEPLVNSVSGNAWSVLLPDSIKPPPEPI